MNFILPALVRLQKGEVVDGAWLDGSLCYNIIPKSSEKLLVLDLLWKTMDNGSTGLNKIHFVDSYGSSPDTHVH